MSSTAIFRYSLHFFEMAGSFRTNPCRAVLTNFLLKPDVGVDDVETTTSPIAQAAGREAFARPQENRQKQRLTAWGNEQTKQFDPGG